MDTWRATVVLSLKAALKAVVAGDVGALNALLTVPEDRLLEAARDVELVLDRESLAGVLRRLRDRQIDGGDAQRWASFIRRGYIGGQNSGRVKPITVEYEPFYEDEIVDIISRLDEIGDVIDGDIPRRGEISDYLALLGLADVN